MDANKRTALMSALVFLGLNGQRLDADPRALYELVDGVAAGRVDQAEVSVPALRARVGGFCTRALCSRGQLRNEHRADLPD